MLCCCRLFVERENKQNELQEKDTSIFLSLILPGNCPISLYVACVFASSCSIQSVQPAFTSRLFCFAFQSNNLHMASVMMMGFLLHEMACVKAAVVAAFEGQNIFTLLIYSAKGRSVIGSTAVRFECPLTVMEKRKKSCFMLEYFKSYSKWNLVRGLSAWTKVPLLISTDRPTCDVDKK